MPAACGTVYTAHRPWQNVIDRLPDGTGSWADHGNNSTPGARNDGGAGSCSLGSFFVQAQAYALACPNTRATVSVTARCADGTTKSDYAGTVSLNLDQVSAAVYTTSTGGSSVNEITFDGTEGGSRIIYVYDNDEHTTVLTASDGAASGSDSIDFRAYGFLISSVPATNACTAGNLTLTAYGQNSSASGCAVIEGFTGSKALKVWFDYVEPNTNANGTALVITDAAGNQSLPTTQPASENIELSFASGVAGLPFSYADAGKLQLSFRYDQAPYDGSEFSPMLASSNNFTVVPAGFGLRAYTMPGDLDLDNGTDSGTPRWPAGDDFRMQVRAQCADGTVLTNYQPTDAQMWVEMVLPSGKHPGTLTLKGNDYLSTYAAPAGRISVVCSPKALLVTARRTIASRDSLKSVSSACMLEMPIISVKRLPSRYSP